MSDCGNYLTALLNGWENWSSPIRQGWRSKPAIRSLTATLRRHATSG